MAAAPAAYGPKKFLQVGLEATWKTGVAATHRIALLDFSAPKSVGLVEDRSGSGSANRLSSIPTIASVAGWFEVILDYDLHGILLDWAYGTATYGSAGESVSGAGPYVHTLRDSKLVFNSLTLQLGEGDIPSTKCATVVGAKCTRMTLRGSGSGDGALIIARFEYLAADKSYTQTPTSLSDRTRVNVLWTHISALTNGSADSSDQQSILSFEYVIENPLTMEATGRSPSTIDEPVLMGPRKTSLKLTQRMHTVTLQGLFAAIDSTQFLTPTLTFTSSPRILALTFPKARLVSPVDPDSFANDSIATQTLDFECYDGGTHASQMALTNAKATILTV